MAKFSDTIDLYDDQGKLLKSGVALDKVSPLTNAGIKKMISLTKRTVAVNLGGAEAFLKTGKAGKNQIPGRELNLDLVANAGAIKEKMFKMLQVTEGDDTEIKEFGGGKLLLCTVPTARIDAAATYDAAMTAVSAAATYAVIDQFNVDMFNGSTVKAAFWGTTHRPWTVRNQLYIHSVHSTEQRGLGYALRNIQQPLCAITNKNAMQGAALSQPLNDGEFEMGAVGPFERAPFSRLPGSEREQPGL